MSRLLARLTRLEARAEDRQWSDYVRDAARRESIPAARILADSGRRRHWKLWRDLMRRQPVAADNTIDLEPLIIEYCRVLGLDVAEVTAEVRLELDRHSENGTEFARTADQAER